MAIERFEYENGGHGPSKFYKSPSGSLVRFSDYSMLALENEALRAANARLQAWHDAVMGQETIGFEIVFKTGKWLKYDPSGFAPETKTELIIRPQPLAKE